MLDKNLTPSNSLPILADAIRRSLSQTKLGVSQSQVFKLNTFDFQPTGGDGNTTAVILILALRQIDISL